MNRILDHLEMISLPTVVAGLVLLLAACFAIPRPRRLEAALAVMAFGLTLGRLPDIGAACNIAKVSSGFLFLLVTLAALTHPGRRSRLGIWYWSYVPLALLSLYYVKGTADFYFASAIRAQWLLLVLAALTTARTVTDQRSLEGVLRGVFLGLSLGGVLTFIALLQDPLGAFRAGFGRFTPYGCNPNQIGITYALIAGLGLCFALRSASLAWRGVCLFMVAIAVGQSLLTVSRGSFMVLTLLAFPSMQGAARRPAFILAGVVLIAPVVSQLLSITDVLSFDRLNRGLISRTETTAEVLQEVKQRPLYGMGFTTDLYAYDTDLNAHNAYVSTLYLGGISLAGPLFTLQAIGLWRAFRCWQHRHRLPFAPQFIALLACLTLAVFAQGFVNDMSVYPTYTWAYLNVCVTCIAVAVGQRLRPASRRGSAPLRRQSRPNTRRTWSAPPRRADAAA